MDALTHTPAPDRRFGPAMSRQSASVSWPKGTLIAKRLFKYPGRPEIHVRVYGQGRGDSRRYVAAAKVDGRVITTDPAFSEWDACALLVKAIDPTVETVRNEKGKEI